MRKNVELVQAGAKSARARRRDHARLLDGFTEGYTVEMAAMIEPYRVYWMEECLQPHDYAGIGRLNADTSTRMATGEHEYTRYGFRSCWTNGRRTSGSRTFTGAAG